MGRDPKSEWIPKKLPRHSNYMFTAFIRACCMMVTEYNVCVWILIASEMGVTVVNVYRTY